MGKKAASAPATEPAAQVEQQPAAEPVEQHEPAASAPATEPAAPTANEPSAPVADVEPLASYVARIEEQAQPLPVCQITHPDAKDGGLHVGKYAGIRLVRGDAPAALLSDGSTI